jgi:N4-gp56 family major capsid protein
MAAVTTDTIAAAVTFKVQKKVLENLRGELFFADPKMSESGTFDAGTDTIMFLSYADLPINTTPLTEGTPPTARALTQATVVVDTDQYGDLVDITDLAKKKSPLDIVDIASERISRQAAESIDKIARDSIAVGGTAVYQTGDTTRAGLASTDYATAADLMTLRARMKAAKVPTNADGTYWFMTHPYVIHDLKSEALTGVGSWVGVNQYARPELVMKGEIGTYHGFRMLEIPNAPTAASTTTVYLSFAGGRIKGWGSGELQTLAVYHTPAGGKGDELHQKESMGWKVDLGFANLNNSYYYRFECATSIGSA